VALIDRRETSPGTSSSNCKDQRSQLARLAITGASAGVFFGYGSGNRRITIEENTSSPISKPGIYVGNNNEDFRHRHNRLHDMIGRLRRGRPRCVVDGTSATITGTPFSTNPADGIYVTTAAAARQRQ